MADASVSIDIIAIDAASNILEGIAGQFGVLGEVAVAAVGAAAGALGFLVTQGADAQDTFTLFDAVISNSSLSVYKDQLLNLADAESKVTRFSDETIVSTETVLARYTNLGDKIPEVTKLSLDLATMMGEDAPSAAQQLGKALEDIGGGSLTLLARTRLFNQGAS